VRDGGGGRAWEHPGKVEKAMECSIWALEDRVVVPRRARAGRRRPLAGMGLMLGSGVQWEVSEGAMGSIWVEEGRRRRSTGAGGRRRLCAAAAAPRLWRRDEAGPCGFSRAVWWWFGARWRLEWGGGASSSSAHQWRRLWHVGARAGACLGFYGRAG